MKINFATYNLSKTAELKIDSRDIAPGDVFVAILGHSIDGRNYIDQAIEKKASLIIAESYTKNDSIDNSKAIPIIYIKNLNSKLSSIAGDFYQHPSKKLQLVGVTGTNGKTTITQLISQWANLLNIKVATMGTLGNGIYGHITTANNTTGSATDIQSWLNKFVKQQVKVVAIEASSHGLQENRIEDLTFAVAVFTNLTRDHLDYHQTMENYIAAKYRLFNEFDVANKVINIDDEIGSQWAKLMSDAFVISTTKQDITTHKNWIIAKDIKYLSNGIEIKFSSNFGNGAAFTKLLGKFNVTNILLAFATMLSLGYKFDDLLPRIPKLESICGRMEVFTSNGKATVVVDYAHTPDALKQALDAIRIHTTAKIWCVFGCGGDRDKGKRPLMGKIAENLADEIIVTNDNPRTEEAKSIIYDIMQGIQRTNKVNIISDRKQAIEYAIKNAHEQDIILIAGKGHEDYQIIGSEKMHFSDREIAQQLLGK